MTILSIALSQLTPSKANARKLLDVASLEGLAASIRAYGLLQNIVVVPVKGKRFVVISDKRRNLVLKRLEKRGELLEKFTVPVEIRAETSKVGRLRLTTADNRQRANVTPMEQTEAVTRLVKRGDQLENLAARYTFAGITGTIGRNAHRCAWAASAESYAKLVPMRGGTICR